MAFLSDFAAFVQADNIKITAKKTVILLIIMPEPECFPW
jgi:hypothetical protein